MKEKFKLIGSLLVLPIVLPFTLLLLLLKGVFSTLRGLVQGIESVAGGFVAVGIVLCVIMAVLGGGLLLMYQQDFIRGSILTAFSLLLSGAIASSSLNLPSDEFQRASLFKGLSSLLGLVALGLVASGLYWGLWENNTYIGWLLAGSGAAMFVAMTLGIIMAVLKISGNK